MQKQGAELTIQVVNSLFKVFSHEIQINITFLSKYKMMHKNFGGDFNCPDCYPPWLWA